MKFLYSDNGNGLVSSLMGSWVFWLVIVLVIVVILVFVVSSNANLQKRLKVDKYFTKTGALTADATASDAEIDAIHRSLLQEIEEGNRNENMPIMNKFLGDDIDDETLKSAQPFGVSETDKNVKSVYHVSSKRDNVFRLASDDIPENIGFKIELRDLSKISFNPQTTESEMRLYNADHKCVAIFRFEPKFLRVQSISPFMDDITVAIEEPVRLLVFTQRSNELYLDAKKIAKFNIYDRLTYFYIKSPIIKELQYFVN